MSKNRSATASFSDYVYITIAMAAEGMITIESSHSVKETADRLENVLTKKGMTVFKRVNHGSGAKNVGIDLRETELVVFGNPKIGSPLMVCQQSAAIDLPQKALIWKDAQNRVWFSYNAPAYLKKRHNITGCDKVLGKITNALANFAKGATSK